jgi:iron complex outermembrane receptor protein
MPGARHLSCPAVLILLICLPLTGRAETSATDSLITNLPALTVSGVKAELPSSDQTRVDAPAIQVQDPGSLADIGGLIPSARVATNSRGDRHLMIRGAPERHVQAFLDGIPLNLAWDERVDLQTVPIIGTGRLAGTRGLTTLLDGPGVLAGSVNIIPVQSDRDAPHNRVSVVAGDHVFGRTDLQHQNRFGPWQVLGAMGWQGRNAVNLPAGVIETDGADRRLNSDLSQYAGLLRGSRAVSGVGRLNLLANFWSAEKGVPAELHLGDDARFWRYPVRRRALLGASLDLPLNDAGTWDLATALSADFFHQEIDPRGPDNWDTAQEPGQDYEKNWDRTGYAKVRATHWLGTATRLALQTTGRYTQHREIQTVGGPTDQYSQWLASAVAEIEFHPAVNWQARLGAGLDHAATPEAGPQPANSGQNAPAWNARLTRPLPGNAELHLAASRRSRAPSLRELYSGALGRFVPNPDLQPERQNLYEAGYTRVAPRWRLEAAAFLLYLSDGIERVSLNNTERQYQRINQTEIRVPGVELAGGWQLADTVELSLQHTVLIARVKQDGQFDRPAEDRPDYLSRVGLSRTPQAGPGMLLEAVITGARWSADATAPSGLRRLPAGVVWNARLSWRLPRLARGLDLHLRLDNIFNQRVDDQIGLPNPGQTLSGGATVSF